MSVSGGVEHIGVLYSRQSLTEALGWLNQTFARHGKAPVDSRGPWIGLLFLSLVALAWPLAQLLPRVAAAKLGAGLGWRRLLPVATSWSALTVAAVMLAAYSVGAIGWPIDTYLTSFWPIPRRLPLILAVLAGTLPYFVTDEWATRGTGAAPGGYVFTKLCFLLSLVLAVALNLPRLLFLIIIVPMIFLFLIVYGLFATWAHRRTWHPLVGAVANALAFAWAIAVTFPVVR